MFPCWLGNDKLLEGCDCAWSMPNPQLTKLASRRMDGYVDDTTVWTNGWKNNKSQLTDSAIHKNLQQAAQHWETLLTATGGKLELAKCFYYIIQWQLTKSGIVKPVPPKDTSDLPPLQITDSITNETSTIQHLNSTESHCTLGVMLNPTGSNEKEYARLIEKARALRTMLNQTPLRPEEARLVYQVYILPAISYGMAISALTIPQLNSIQSTLIPTLAQKLGLNRYFPRAILHGPIKFGGLGIPYLPGIQLAIQAMTLISHMRRETPLGTLLHITLDWMQLTAGTTWSLLQHPSRQVPHLDDKWINSLRQGMKQAKAHITLHSLYTVQLQRRNDSSIMDTALTHGLTRKEIQCLNNWRIYLQAETLADLTDASGTYLLQRESTLPSTPVGPWPNSLKPAGKLKKFWSIVKTIYQIPPDGKLPRPLGNWNDLPQRRSWTHYYDRQSKKVFVSTQDKLWRTQTTSSSRRGTNTWITYLPIDPSEPGIPKNSIPWTAVPVLPSRRDANEFRAPTTRRLLVKQTPRRPLPTFVTPAPTWRIECGR